MRLVNLYYCFQVLPVSFGYYLEKSISSVVKFMMPNNECWSIFYEEDPPRFSLLKEFVSFYGLRENYFLIFDYVGDSRFFVRVFDDKSLEILYVKASKALVRASQILSCSNPFKIGNGETGTIFQALFNCTTFISICLLKLSKCIS